MERKHSLDEVCQLFQSLSEEKRKQFLDAKQDNVEYQVLMSQIFSELQMLKGEGVIDQLEGSKRKGRKRVKPSKILWGRVFTHVSSFIGVVAGLGGIMTAVFSGAKKYRIRGIQLKAEKKVDEISATIGNMVPDLADLASHVKALSFFLANTKRCLMAMICCDPFKNKA